ncbi:MAG: type IV secretory system conjugative DNA transfer family protein [bacterium]|nr:type IV secretory system conjugative DNA transfer family protein [bacterium]
MREADVVRALWVLVDGRWVFGVSVPRGLGASVRRAVGSVWPNAVVERWPVDDTKEVSDGVPIGEGGGTVIRRFLMPEVLSGLLRSPEGVPDHPMARVLDVAAGHPGVDVQLRVDVVPLSPVDRDRVCEARLGDLGEHDPDRGLWEADDKRATVEGVRVLLRVSRAGAGHAAECERIADRIVGVLDSLWSTDHNGLTVRAVPNGVFDRMWERGAVEKDGPCWHWACLEALLGPPPAKIARTAGRRLPDPPRLETFSPQAPGGLMPVGVIGEGGTERLVGVSWGGPTDALVDWTIGASGSGKTWHALSRVVALAETGRGFLLLDPHRTAVRDVKRFLGARHAGRMVEIDLEATDRFGEPVSAGWNPLDLTVVPQVLRKGRIDNLRGALPGALFPTYFGADGKSPQTATLIRKALECLLHLNQQLPAEIQANVFCMEQLWLDETWRRLAVGRLKPRDQKWWHHTYPMIVGEKGAGSSALKPALNGLEQWKTQDRVQALLGASQSTLRWREIMDEGQILLVVLTDGESETDRLLARLMVGEMVAAFKERGLTHQAEGPVRPFHLFLDEFQTYAEVLEAQFAVIVQELRKRGAKVHFINQSPSAVPKNTRETILSNRTHMFCGLLGNPSDAETIARAMGGQRGSRPQQDHQGPSGLESRDLLKLARWHFISQVTQNGQRSKPFQLRGIDADQTWAHLRSDRDITAQIAENSGLVPVEQRLDHYDTLPARIVHWLQTGNLLTIQQTHDFDTTPPPQTTVNNPSVSEGNDTGPTQQGRPPSADTAQETFDAWADAQVIEDVDAATPPALLADSYTRWCRTKSIQPLPERTFQQLLTLRYGPSETARVNGNVTRVRRGIKPRRL